MPAIKIAIKHLECLKAHEGESWSVAEGQNARIWETLLNQSQKYAIDNVAPHRLRNDIGTVAGVELGKRRWDQFRRWLKSEVKPTLQDELASQNLPMLHEARVSNPKGGRHEISEAEYYLSYKEGEPIPSRSKYNKRNDIHTNDEESTTDDQTKTEDSAVNIGPININLTAQHDGTHLHYRRNIAMSTATSLLSISSFYLIITVVIILLLTIVGLPNTWSRSVGLLADYLGNVETLLRALFELLDDRFKLGNN
ncbi:MAG: hypothetical protein AB2632_02540 [Candidatus Thiodiazotropha sp.]